MVIALRGIADDVGFSRALLSQSLMADAGFDVSVPQEVIDARGLLHQYEPGTGPVALGPGLHDHPLLHQRMAEALYPVRLHESTSGRMIWMAPGPDAPGCTVIGRSDTVVLADCN